MVEINFNDYYLVNSSRQVFLFKKTEEDKVESSSLNFLSEESVYLYSVSIDSNDNIYILILSKSGELNLYIYNNMLLPKKTIAQFDLRANSYRQLEIKIVNDKVNIFYSFSNLSISNIWIIQHLVFNKTVEEKHTVVRYASNNLQEPYILDFDNNGNIHLVYSNNSQVYYNLYNPYTKRWNKSLSQISMDGSINSKPYIFVDSKDYLHCLWLNMAKDNNKVKYIRMNSKGKNPFVWKQIILPYLLASNIIPIIFEEEDVLKLVYSNDENIKYLYSQDSGNNWVQGNKSKVIELVESILTVSSNLKDNSKAKHLIQDFSEIIPNEVLDLLSLNLGQELIEKEVELMEELTIQNSDDIISLDLNQKSLELILDNQNELKDLILSLTKTQILTREEIINLSNVLENKSSLFKRLFG